MLIDHRCLRCGHLKMWRLRQRHNCSTVGCACATNRSNTCAWGDPETIPTFSSLPGAIACQPEQRILQPGAVVNAYPQPATRTCDCDDCKALYAAMVAA